MFGFTLCADDYALTPGVSRGILKLLEAGRLTAVSVMVTQPGWPHAASELRSHASTADIGLHLNLTLGAPVGATPRLAPGGEFPALGQLVRSALLRRLPITEVKAEIARQIDAFTEHFRRLPDYVDGHQHVHALPGIRDALVQTLGEQGLAGRLWLRNPADRLRRMLARPLPQKALAVAALAAGFRGPAGAAGFALNEGFAGFSDFLADRDYASTFPDYLRSPGTRHLVMCHPGYSDDALAALDPATSSRETELAFLASPQFPEVLAARSAELIRLSDSIYPH
jgi:chitin disaccharide deacetylase